MVGQQRAMDEPIGSELGGRTRGSGIGTLFFLTACGIGLGMLAAPEAGRQTRKRLGKRLATIGGEVIDRWSEVQDRFGEVREAGARAGQRARKRMRDRVSEFRDDVEERWSTADARLAALEDRLDRMGGEDDEEEGGGGFLTATLGLAAGAGLAYLLIADSAAPARSKVQQMASDVRDQATDRWQRFRRGGTRAAAGADANTFGDVDET